MLWSAGERYRDRREAGERLLEEIRRVGVGVGESGSLVVLGAPRGGVAVAVPVALGLGAPLDVVLARKLPAPGNPELGFGAVGEGGVRVVDREIVELLGLDEEEIATIAARVQREVEERAVRYRRARAALPLEGRTALVVDDGVATGVTMEAAVASARGRGATRVVAAAPVSSVPAKERLDGAADLFICPLVDPGFVGVGAYYGEFPQLDDEDVVELLGQVGDQGIGNRG
jgi:putative phosphoribosyl transferase